MSLLDRAILLADVPPPSDRTYDYKFCVKVINLQKYPKYRLFISINDNVEDPTVREAKYISIDSSRCIPMSSERAEATIAALPRQQVRSSDLKTSGTNKILQSAKLKKALIPANIKISSPGSLPLINRGKTIEQQIEIISLDRSKLVLSKIEGSVPLTNWIFLPLVGIGILSLLAISNNKKSTGNRQ
jgi:hypothetical protein